MLKQAVLVSSILAVVAVTSFADNSPRQNNRYNNAKQFDKSTTTLTTAQKEGLSFMIEEEKVARDVYAYLYNTWGIAIFNNISQSEQKHMNAVQNLLNKYNLTTPSTLESQGLFHNQELQDLYNSLIEKGEASPLDAFEVGVMIEEMDIQDLKELMATNIPSDVKSVYSNLLRGSYSHLNAFNRQLARQ